MIGVHRGELLVRRHPLARERRRRQQQRPPEAPRTPRPPAGSASLCSSRTSKLKVGPEPSGPSATVEGSQPRQFPKGSRTSRDALGRASSSPPATRFADELCARQAAARLPTVVAATSATASARSTSARATTPSRNAPAATGSMVTFCLTNSSRARAAVAVGCRLNRIGRRRRAISQLFVRGRQRALVQRPQTRRPALLRQHDRRRPEARHLPRRADAQLQGHHRRRAESSHRRRALHSLAHGTLGDSVAHDQFDTPSPLTPVVAHERRHCPACCPHD